LHNESKRGERAPSISRHPLAFLYHQQSNLPDAIRPSLKLPTRELARTLILIPPLYLLMTRVTFLFVLRVGKITHFEADSDP
jgi:hypothetical protein